MNFNAAYIIHPREITLRTLENRVLVSQEDMITMGKRQH